jgi:hypothetical protein
MKRRGTINRKEKKSSEGGKLLGQERLGGGAQGARMANAKVKNRRFPLSSDL